MNFGNVFENGVMNVLNHPTYQDFRRQWYANKAPDFCGKCHFLEIEPIYKMASAPGQKM
jgi:hypothetical protein